MPRRWGPHVTGAARIRTLSLSTEVSTISAAGVYHVSLLLLFIDLFLLLIRIIVVRIRGVVRTLMKRATDLRHVIVGMAAIYVALAFIRYKHLEC